MLTEAEGTVIKKIDLIKNLAAVDYHLTEANFVPASWASWKHLFDYYDQDAGLDGTLIKSSRDYA